VSDAIIEKPDIPEDPPPVPWWKRMLRILLALVIVAAGIAGAAYLRHTAPTTNKRPPAEWVPVVKTERLQSTSYRVNLSAMGTVMPARQVVLRSRVAGQVVSVHPEFTEGGFLQKGDRVLQLDDADYRLALTRAEADLTNARYAFQLELGRQEVAQKEWSLLNGGKGSDPVDSALALRKPHLDKAKSDVASAEAAVEKAALDLDRTRIQAPFNALVRSRSVDLGSQVAPQEALAELVGTDAYWIQASIPVGRLDWIDIPRSRDGTGAAATVYYAGDHSARGQVVRLLGDLANEGRMARIMVEVKDPLRRKSGRGGAPLLIGEYVRVEIEGRQLSDVFVVPRTALRDDATVWLVGDDNTLQIREVNTLWRDADTVVLKDSLKEGDALVVTDLPAPVAGMKVRLESSRPAMEPSSSDGASDGQRGDGRG
jgi:RND family efflux transporter MFP subunit